MSRPDPTRAHLRGGDPLRALAALGVVVGHVAVYALAAVLGRDVATVAPADVTAAWGAAGHVMAVVGNGVWLFFVLSGYLIARPAVGAWIRGRPQPSLRRYVRNRLVRIVPAFWVVAGLTLLLLGAHGASVGRVLAIPAFLQVYAPSAAADRIGQAWTLDAELAFYALVPLAGWALTRVPAARRRGPEARAALVVALALGIAALSLGSSLALGRDPEHLRWAPAVLFAFMPGVALGALEHLLGRRVAGSRRAARAAGPVALLGVAVFALATVPALPGGSGRLVVVAGAGLVLGGVALRQWATGTCWRRLECAPLRWVGERSYSLYLVHIAVLLVLADLLPGDAGAWEALAFVGVPGVVVSLLLCDLLHRAVERPCLAWRAGSPGGSGAPAPARSASTAAASDATSSPASSPASLPTAAG